MTRWAVLALAALATACLKPPPGNEGARCDADHGCESSDLECRSNRCVPRLDTLLDDGDFEAGIAAWAPLDRTSGQLWWSQVGTNDSLALCTAGLRPSDPAAHLGALLAPLALDGGSGVCVELSVRAASAGAATLRFYSADGNHADADAGSWPSTDGGWRQLRGGAAPTAGFGAGVSLRLGSLGPLCLDDVRLWSCAGGVP